MADLADWMKAVPDDTNLGHLSLAGTHNSAACHRSFPSVRCQGASVTEQLEHGVRFIDIRAAAPFRSGFGRMLGSSTYDLQVIHGHFPVAIPFAIKLRDLLDELYAFLRAHSSETVLVSIKAEGPVVFPGTEFSSVIWERYIQPVRDLWFLENRLPSVGETRGRAILFRRFSTGRSDNGGQMGFDASWGYNVTEHSRGNLVVQDWCEVILPTDISRKSRYIIDQLNRAKQYNETRPTEPRLYVNFCSGCNFWNRACWPRKVAEGVAAVSADVGRGCGLVILDYAETNDWEAVRKLVESNV